MPDRWTDETDPPLDRSGGEPAITAPAGALALAGLLLLAFVLQSAVAPPALVNALVYAPAPTPLARPLTLFTAIWLHGGWGHLGMNAAFALAFATPLARFLGTGVRGTVSLFLYFSACGVLGNLGFGALHAGQSYGLIGASGGVSGLAAGAARIVGGNGGIGGLRSPFVVSMGVAWILSNLVVAVAGGALIEGGAQIAWEAHLAGFVAGFVLLRPFAALAGASRA
ncbi:MAG: rhomboid family intramembrane serine protease [Phenylobacterium sp.]